MKVRVLATAVFLALALVLAEVVFTGASQSAARSNRLTSAQRLNAHADRLEARAERLRKRVELLSQRSGGRAQRQGSRLEVAAQRWQEQAERLREKAQRHGWVRVLVELETPGVVPVPEHRLHRWQVKAQRKEIARSRDQVIQRLRRTGYRVVRRYATVPLLALEVRADALAELEAATFYVKRVVEDRLNTTSLFESVPLVGADQAWARGADGTGTVVAIIDTGVDRNHPFLAGKVVEEACFSSKVPGVSKSLCPNGKEEQIGPGAATPCTLPGCWHGTHVAGIAAGDGTEAGVEFSGVAKGASLMAVQVFSRFDSSFYCGGSAPCALAYTSDVLAALEHVYLLRDQHAFAAANLSLGGQLFSSPCDDEPYKPFIDNLRTANIATVVGSGNDGSPTSMSSPACVSSAVSVGSTSKTDTVSWFSNVTPFLSLLAPGENILSSVPGADFAFASGTSMATPHVAGAWAVLKQAAPNASVDEALTALQLGGVPITDTRSGTAVTVPRIQVGSALSVLLGEVRIASVSPATGTRGTTLDVTITGINFEPGTAVSFGAGVAVNTVTIASPTQLVANVTIAAAAALGPRDVTVTNPNGTSATLADGFTVMPPPPTLTLAYLGTLRDRVGQHSTAYAPDGALDGTFTVKVEPGSGPREVTSLKLQSSSGGVWDSVGSTTYWALGAASGLDSGLLNDAGQSFPVAEGETFTLFAAGTSFTLTAALADGTTATVTTTVQALPEITGLTPASATPGRTLTVTVHGANFVSGATVDLGAGVTVNSTSFVSASELAADVSIDPTAAFGPRDVIVTNPDGGTGVRQRGFTVAMVTMAHAGKLRDRVGQSTSALEPDGALDATFTVAFEPGSGSRTITALTLEGSSGGVWDTAGSTSFWALGAASTLDAALLNDSTGAVNFTVPDGGGFIVFAADLSSGTVFGAGTTFTLTLTFGDGSTMTAEATIGASLAVTGVSPASGPPGATLDVTVDGSGFETGSGVSFGPDVTVNSTVVGSATQITANVTIAPTAALGPRDVRVTTLSGESATLPGGFAVAPPPATLTLDYLDKARDRVGQNTTALVPDGALDGSFTVRLEPGSGDRTVIALELRSSNGGVWDTDGATAFWALGAAPDLDGALLNDAGAAVNFTVVDGASFVVFAADLSSSSLFTPGTTFTLTARLADGTQASATTTIVAPPTVTSVTPAQGQRGQTLDVTIQGANFQNGATTSFGADVTVESTTFVSSSQLGARLSIAADATLGPRDVTVTNPDGRSGTLAGGFGVTPDPPTLTMAYPGMLRDRVGRQSTAFGADGAPDGTFTVRIEPGSGNRTVTWLELRSSSGGVWDTVAATGFWALGAAMSLDGALLNAPSTGAVNFGVADGGAFALFAADFASGTLFAPGTTFTLTASFADGTTASASTVVGAGVAVSDVAPREASPGTGVSVAITGTNFLDGAAVSFGPGVTVDATTFVSPTRLTADVTVVPGAALGPRDVTVTNPGGESATLPGAFTVTPISLAFQGKLRDRVGMSTTALSADGYLDGTFTVHHQAGGGARTVTAMTLRSSAGGVWDTDGATSFWALGAADGLDDPLLNLADASVDFTVADGGSFVLFAGEYSGWTLFPSGTSFTLTVTFSDGTTATATASVP